MLHSCETKPIWRRQAGKTIAKASGLDAATLEGDKRAKQSQLGPEAGPGESRQGGRPSPRQDESCETKPIRPEASETTSAAEKRSYEESTKQRTSAKRSQFAADRLEEVWAAGVAGAVAPGDKCAKRSQFPHRQGWPKARMLTGVTGRTYRAKRSQFSPGRPEQAPAPGPAVLLPPGTNVQNEANLRGLKFEAGRSRANVQNKANFRQSGRDGDVGSTALCRPHLFLLHRLLLVVWSGELGYNASVSDTMTHRIRPPWRY